MMAQKVAVVGGVLVLAFLVGAGLVQITNWARSGSSNGSGTAGRRGGNGGSGTEGGSGTSSYSLPKDVRPVADGATLELTAEAVCGNCFLGIGDPRRHSVVFLSKKQPKLVIPVPNAKLAEIEKVTGQCADGSIEVTVKGTGSRYGNKNYLTISSFTHRRLRQGSGTSTPASGSGNSTGQ